MTKNEGWDENLSEEDVVWVDMQIEEICSRTKTWGTKNWKCTCDEFKEMIAYLIAQARLKEREHSIEVLKKIHLMIREHAQDKIRNWEIMKYIEDVLLAFKKSERETNE